MQKRQQENTNSVSELPVRKSSQTEIAHSKKIQQKLKTRIMRSATLSGKNLHKRPCRILPPSKPSMGSRLSKPRDRLDSENSASQGAVPEKGKERAKHKKLISGPAKQSMVISEYAYSLPVVFSRAPSTSSRMCVRSIESSLAAIIWPSSCMAAAQRLALSGTSGVVAIMQRIRIKVAGVIENCSFIVRKTPKDYLKTIYDIYFKIIKKQLTIT